MVKIINFLIAILLFFTANVVASEEFLLGSKEILLENDKVQVVKLVYPPKTESGMHTHQYANRTVYVVSGGELALIASEPTNIRKVVTLTAGQVLYVPAATHNVRNVGNSKIILIETELK